MRLDVLSCTGTQVMDTKGKEIQDWDDNELFRKKKIQLETEAGFEPGFDITNSEEKFETTQRNENQSPCENEYRN